MMTIEEEILEMLGGNECFYDFDPSVLPTKRRKVSYEPEVYTFGIDSSLVHVQLLSYHTLYDLVDSLLIKCHLKDGKRAYDHLWDVKVNGIKYDNTRVEGDNQVTAEEMTLGELDLVVGSELSLEYNYGPTMTHTIKTLHITKLGRDNPALYPRVQPVSTISVARSITTMIDSGPHATVPGIKRNTTKIAVNPYMTTAPTISSENVDLNRMFPNFNHWAFEPGARVELNMFQADDKPVFGYCYRQYAPDPKQIIFLPTKYASLELYLNALNEASKRPYAKGRSGYAIATWHSIVMVQEKDNAYVKKRYLSHTDPGSCDAGLLYNRTDLPQLAKTFPRVSALMGCNKMYAMNIHDTIHIPKGWMTYKNSKLSIYTGDCDRDPRSGCPPGTAFEGEDQYTPTTRPLVQKRKKVKSLQQLLELAEEMLQKLG